MRISLQKLLQDTLEKKYRLPHKKMGVDRAKISNHNDHVFVCTSNKKLVELIYNSIIDYSFNEFEVTQYSYDNLLVKALKTKIKYDPKKSELVKVRYGFYGEVLLYAILYHFFRAKPLIARGYFYHILENSETKGYDSYHLVEHKKRVYLWFGEVKFRESLDQCVKSALKGLDKALSDNYLSENILEFDDYRNNFNIKDSKVEQILNSWRDNPNIKIIDEIKKYNMTLVYPILLIFSDKDPCFEQKISNAINCINKHSQLKKYSLSIDYKLFFILMPLEEIKKIKQEVIQWIESKKPLLS